MEERNMLTAKEREELVSLREECDFYSNAGKPERERWTTEKFLNLLKESYHPDQIISMSEESIGDVEYRTSDGVAYFEIKNIHNILKNNLREEDENLTGAYKKLRGVIEKCFKEDKLYAKEISNALNHPFLDCNGNLRAFDVEYEDGVGLVLKIVEEYTKKYQAKQISLENYDLLVYCLRAHVNPISPDDIFKSNLKHYGWRSISFFNDKMALVLYAASTAPKFLQHKNEF